MVAAMLLGLLLGLDSFRASLALGMFRRGTWERLRIAVGFALFDGLAPLLGFVLGSALVNSLTPWSARVGPIVLGGFGIFTFLKARGDETRRSGEEVQPAGDRWVGLALPLLLSIDNLVVGLGLGSLGLSAAASATLIGTISGLMSLAGLSIGSTVGRAMPARAERIGGAVLTVVAVFLAFDPV